jgi:hypothetical protein
MYEEKLMRAVFGLSNFDYIHRMFESFSLFKETIMSKLIITDVAIRQDSQNRYCLNDLHKSAVLSGANKRTKEPSKFLSSPQTIDLIKELTDTQNLGLAPINIVKGGNSSQQGTYVVKELVYSYAMWINAAFHIKIIRAYDAFVTNQTFDFLKPISEPLSIADFEWRYQVISNCQDPLDHKIIGCRISGW